MSGTWSRKPGFLAVLISLIAVSAIIARLLAPWAIRKELTALIKENCEDCAFSVKRVTVALIPFEVAFEGARLIWGNPLATGYEVSAGRIVTRISLERLIHREFSFEQIRFEGLDVVVTEGDLRSPASKSEERAPKAAWTFAVQDTQVLDAKFTYIRVSGHGPDARRAALHVGNIQGAVEPLGTVSDLKARTVRAHARGRLEDSGGFHLTVATPPFSRNLSADIDLRIAGQNLSDLNGFFEKNDGIKFAGSLYDGHVSIGIRGSALNTSVEAKYLGLNIQFQKTKERSQLAAFFSNLAKSVEIDKSSLGAEPRNRVRTAELQRETSEAFFHFIFRGVKEAALKVATASR